MLLYVPGCLRGRLLCIDQQRRMPGGVFTRNYYHFARLCAPVRAVVGVDISWCALSHRRQFGSNYEVLANFSSSAGLESKTGLQLSIFQLFA